MAVLYAANTTLSSGNLNQGIQFLDSTTSGRLASAHFAPAASPAFVNTSCGFASVAKEAAGDYSIVFDSAYAAIPDVQATAQSDSGNCWTAQVYTVSTSGCRVQIFKDGALSETGLDFIHVTVVGVVSS